MPRTPSWVLVNVNVADVEEHHALDLTIFFPFQDANIVKVIERQLTENERFMLAKAARCIAFSICPIKLAPK